MGEAAAADPVAPVVYTHPFYHHMAAPVYAHHPAVCHHAPVYTHHVAPVVYAAANVCKNEGGQLVPCAHGVAPGSAIYAMADAPTVAAAPAAAPQEEAVVSVEKRDAEADAEADPQLGIMDTMDIPMDIIMDMPDTTDIMDILTTDTVELDAETTSELWFPALANKMCSN